MKGPGDLYLGPEVECDCDDVDCTCIDDARDDRQVWDAADAYDELNDYGAHELHWDYAS